MSSSKSGGKTTSGKTTSVPAFCAPEDRPLLAHLSDCRAAAEKKGAPVFSDFMDPVRAERFRLFFAPDVTAWGGYADAERKMLGFFPDGGYSAKRYAGDNTGPGGGASEESYAAAFPVEILQIKFNRRFNAPPSHRDYLGSVMGLGLERGKIGDVRLTEDGALLYTAADVSGYISAALERVGNTPVKVSVYKEDGAVITEPTGTETRITVASLRLDAVIAGAFRLSRSKASALIESEKVFVNWSAVTSGSKILKEGDKITVRGLGRVRLDEETGRTKKDRHALLVSKMG